jgi:hypothetical protein
MSADGLFVVGFLCLPTAERCLSIGGFFIKIYIFFFDINFSNTYTCCLPTAERCSL